VAGRIYAVANQKGGVGKTTTAVNLAACLAQAGERVLLVDLDPQANATSGLGERANGASSCDLLDGASPTELARPTRFPNLDLIPSKPDLAGTAADLARRGDGERFLAETLGPAADVYPFVFVDCPPSLGPLTVNALAAANRVLVPVQAEYYALEGLSQLLNSLGLIRARLNPELALAGVVLTMVDGRTNLSADVALEVLIGGAGSNDLAHVPVDQIHPNPRQPRKRFDHEATAGLAESIRAQGIIQPVVLRPRPAGGYELIAGERRWRAAREANVTTLPALVRDAADRDALLLGLVENVAREELSPIEEARAYALLTDEFELALGEIAERVGSSKPAVSNRLRLLELSDDVLAMVERGELTEGHARAVLAVPDNEGRRRLARKIVRQGLSVRAAEREARWSGARTKRRRRPPADPQLAERVRLAVEGLTGFSARVTTRGLEIPVENEQQLGELAEALEALQPVPAEAPAQVEPS
jgi:ParB/RepB/Spo0J family partition protein